MDVVFVDTRAARPAKKKIASYFTVVHVIERGIRMDAEFLECISKNGTYIHGIRQDLCVKNIIILEGVKDDAR